MAQPFGPLVGNTVTNTDQSFEAVLIRSVYKFQFLYDSKIPDFTNVTRNRLAWARIAQICRKTLSECENKWHTLLQTYFSSPSNNWIHLAELKKFEPQISNTFGRNYNPTNPHTTQKDELLKALLLHSPKLLSTETSIAERHNIWSYISSQCNAIKPGASMSIIKWQKYWYNIKQDCGSQWYKLRSKLKAMGTKLDVSRYTDDEMNILKICGASPMQSIADITKALGSNIELGSNTELIIPKCKRCLEQRNDLLIDGLCETCRNTPSCDLCSNVCELGEITKYKVKDWSKEAKNLLPIELSSKPEISACPSCSKSLKRQATAAWKTCRVCEADQPNLELLYSNTNNNLRKVFKDATNFSFNENDGLPGYICKVCKIQIQQLNNFYTKFWRTQCRLRTIHSIHFIGNPANQKLMKDGKRVYFNVPPNNRARNVMILPHDISIQCNPPVAAEAATSSATSETPGNNKQICPNPSVAKPPFKRICLRKPVPEEVFSNVYPNEEEVAGNKVTAAQNTLAIKEIFSLQPSAQKSNNNIQSSISVIPTAALQPPKVDEVFSNKNVTITRKTFEVQTASQGHPSTNPNKNKNSILLPKGSSPALQTGNNPMSTNSGVTITKRFATASQPETINLTPIEPKDIHNSTSSVKPQEYIPSLPRCGPLNSKTIIKPNTSSKPAIFTISDYETTADAPPVFCIPKNASSMDTSSFDTEKQLMDFNPDPEGPITKITIKTEIPDNDDEYPSEAPTSQPVPHVEPATKNLPGLPSLSNPQQTTAKSDMKIIRLNGNMVAVKPHPYIPGAFMPIDSDKPMPTSGMTGAPNRFIPSIIRKIDNGHKSQAPPAVMSLNKIPQKIVTTPEKGPTITAPNQIQPKPQATMVTIPEQEEIFHQQQQQQQQQQATKKARKYWGTVDEFQVAPLPNKMPAPPPPLPTETSKSPCMASSTPWIEDRRSPRPSEDPLNIPPVQSPSKVPIKREIPDKDDDDVIMYNAISSNDTIPSMFYPDSFELENVSLGVDVSLMINDIMTQQKSIGGNMEGNNFDKYINPSFPIYFEEKEKISKDEDKVKTIKKEKEDVPEVSKKKEEENVEEIKTESVKNKERRATIESIKLPTSVRLRKLRIKLKRDIRARVSLPRPKRLCTVQLPTPPPPSGKRKSSRLSHNSVET